MILPGSATAGADSANTWTLDEMGLQFGAGGGIDHSLDGVDRRRSDFDDFEQRDGRIDAERFTGGGDIDDTRIRLYAEPEPVAPLKLE
jgi:hypothetical protein